MFSDGADTVDCDVVSLVNKPTPSTVAGRLAAALHFSMLHIGLGDMD